MDIQFLGSERVGLICEVAIRLVNLGNEEIFPIGSKIGDAEWHAIIWLLLKVMTSIQGR